MRTTIPSNKITRHEAAAAAGLSLRSLDSLLASGALPYYRLSPRCVRIDKRDLEAFLESRRVEARAR